MLTHLHSRWFICFPKLRFSDQRKTPQWQTGLCPNKYNKRELLTSSLLFVLYRSSRYSQPSQGTYLIRLICKFRITHFALLCFIAISGFMNVCQEKLRDFPFFHEKPCAKRETQNYSMYRDLAWKYFFPESLLPEK